MARYCFYCGRELAAGEKCSCRTRAAGTTAGSTGSASQQTAAGSSQAKGSARSGPAGQTRQAAGSGAASFGSRFRAFTGRRPFASRKARARPADHLAALAGFAQYLRYLTRPVESIRQAVQYANLSRLAIFMLIHAGIGGFTFLRVAHLGTLDLILQLTRIQTAASPFLRGLFLFIQGSGLVLVTDWLLILITQLTLQFVFRAAYPLPRVAAGFVPVFFYQALFAFAAFCSLAPVPVNALMILIAGFAVGAAALYLAIRQLTSFDENRCFLLLAFVLFVFTALIGLILNLALPVLTLLLEQSLPL